jgi:hypothetical protein
VAAALGDEAIAAVILPYGTSDEMAHSVAASFYEATIYEYGPDRRIFHQR